MVVYSTITSYVLFILSCTTLKFIFACSHSKIVPYISFILSCTMLQFIFLWNLFVLFCCFHTNTLPPCRTEAIDGSHHFLSPAAPSWGNGEAPVPAARPQLSIRLPCPVPIGYTLPINPAKPAPPKPFWDQHAKWCEPVPYFSSYYLPLQAIFKPTRQALWSIPVTPHHITCPYNPFSDRQATRCKQVLHFSSYYLPLQEIFGLTRQALWDILVFPRQITCPYKPFLNRQTKCFEPVP